MLIASASAHSSLSSSQSIRPLLHAGIRAVRTQTHTHTHAHTHIHHPNTPPLIFSPPAGIRGDGRIHTWCQVRLRAHNGQSGTGPDEPAGERQGGGGRENTEGCSEGCGGVVFFIGLGVRSHQYTTSLAAELTNDQPTATSQSQPDHDWDELALRMWNPLTGSVASVKDCAAEMREVRAGTLLFVGVGTACVSVIGGDVPMRGGCTSGTH